MQSERGQNKANRRSQQKMFCVYHGTYGDHVATHCPLRPDIQQVDVSVPPPPEVYRPPVVRPALMSNIAGSNAVQQASSSLRGLCFICHEPGHQKANCPHLASSVQQPVVCYFCHEPGHKSNACPLRQYSAGKPIVTAQLQPKAPPSGPPAFRTVKEHTEASDDTVFPMDLLAMANVIESGGDRKVVGTSMVSTESTTLEKWVRVVTETENEVLNAISLKAISISGIGSINGKVLLEDQYLLDGGASANLMSLNVAEIIGAEIKASDQVLCAYGGARIICHGYCVAYVKFHDRSAYVKFYVVELGVHDPEVLFGVVTLRHMSATMPIGGVDFMPKERRYRPVSRETVQTIPVTDALERPLPVDLSVLRALCGTKCPLEETDTEVIFLLHRNEDEPHLMATFPLDEDKNEPYVVHFEPENLDDDAFDNVDGLEMSSGVTTANVESDEEFLKGLHVDSDVSSTAGDQLNKLLLQYKWTFSPTFVPGTTQNIDGFGTLKGVEHGIDIGDNPAFRMRSRRLPLAQEPMVEKMISDLLEKGAIRESHSPFASVIVLVRKADGSLRFCIDYRRLNDITRKDAYPLPRIDGLLDSLSGKRVFSSLDLKSGYYNIHIREEDRYKTAFVYKDRLFEWTRMPFGLCNAPSTFSRAMRMVFHKQMGKFVSCYIDDILVYSDSIEEHMIHLREVLRTLGEAGLRLNPLKCKFLSSEVSYLGHRIGRDGLAVDPRKVVAVRDFPKPTNKQEMQRFLGLLNYLRRFCQNMAKHTDRLYRMLVGLTGPSAPLLWDSDCDAAFMLVRELVTSTPVLRLPCVGQPYYVTCDASRNGLGAVLEQGNEEDLRPIAYASKSTTVAEKKYSATHLEARAVIFALDAFRTYLLGEKVVIFTDHRPLLSLFTKELPCTKLYRWLLILQQYNIELRYKPGSDNVIADALSRAPVDAVNELESLDTEFKVPEYVRLLNLDDSDQRARLIEEHHSGRIAGHAGAEKTWRRMEPFFSRSWPTLRKDIQAYVSSCNVCKMRSTRYDKLPLMPREPPDQARKRWSLDYTVIRQSSHVPYCLVAIDNFSRWIIAVPCKCQNGATSVKCLKLIMDTFGAPSEVCSDAGSHFTCKEFQVALAEHGIIQTVSTPYAKRANGMVERANRTLQDMLAKNLTSNGRNRDAWYLYVKDTVLAYNVTPHDGLKQLTPFEVMFGSKYCSRGDITEEKPAAYEFWQEVRSKMTQVQQARSGYFKSNCQEIRYVPGDKVFVADRSKMAQRMNKIDLPNSVKATVLSIGRRSAKIQEDGPAGKVRGVPIGILQPRFE